MKDLNWTAAALFLFFLMVLDAAGFALITRAGNDMRVAGWVESVSLFPGNLKIKAKLDTGARNSSLNAKNIKEFYRGGDKWVRFDLKNWKGRVVNFEARVTRTVKIKQLGGKPVTRPVIRLGICLGDVYKEVEVNLEDRSKFNYQLLIGRSYLRDSILVNSAVTFTLEPNCQGKMPK